MAKYIVHKAVLPEKVQKKRQRTDEYMAANYVAQPKFDGCNAVMVLTGGDAYVRSRTNEPVESMASIAAQFQFKYKREIVEFGGIVLLGEAWNPNLPQNVISGLFRRHADAGAELMMMVFDVLTLAEFEAGESSVPYRERINRLTSQGAGDDLVATWDPGTFGTLDEFYKFQASAGGRDGIILRDPEGLWKAGSGTTGEIIKIKRTLSFDLKVIGHEPGKGKHEGRMGALVVDFGGKQLRVGTGFTDAEREAANDFLDKIVEIEAMDYSADGLLREPRFKGIRHDKLEPDTIAA